MLNGINPSSVIENKELHNWAKSKIQTTNLIKKRRENIIGNCINTW